VAGVLDLSTTTTTVVLLFVSENRYQMSTRTSTVYKYFREHYPISKKHSGAREYQVEKTWPMD
jgi:hypothetical protein